MALHFIFYGDLMNIEQIKQDLEAGIMVSRSIVVALVEAALELKRIVDLVESSSNDSGLVIAAGLANKAVADM